MLTTTKWTRSGNRNRTIEMLAWVGVLTLYGCGSTPVDPSSEESVSLVNVSPDNADMTVGDTVRLTASAFSETGAEIRGRSVLWSSSDQAAATITNGGLVTAHAKGRVVIEASVGGVSGFSEVRVGEPPAPTPSRVTVTPGSMTLDPGAEAQLQAQVLMSDGIPMDGVEVSWTSSNGNVVQVTGDGAIRAIDSGSAWIRAWSGALYGEAAIVVRPRPVAYVFVSPAIVTLVVGEQTRARAHTYSAGGGELHGRPVRWSVEDPRIATVDGEGNVLGISKGRTRIQAESEGKIGRADVEVRQWPPEGPQMVFDLRWQPYELRPVVGDTTWIDPSGRPRTSELILAQGELLLDLQTGTYTQRFDLVVMATNEPAVREDRGLAGYLWTEGSFWFTSSVIAGHRFTGNPNGRGDLFVAQTVGTADLRTYQYAIR